MTKKSQNRLVKDGKVEAPKERRNLNKEELIALNRMEGLVNSYSWVTMVIAGNTAMVTDGQYVAKQHEEITKLLMNTKSQWLSQTLKDCGIPEGQAVNVNSKTGEIVDAKKEDKPIEVKIKDNEAKISKTTK